MFRHYFSIDFDPLHERCRRLFFKGTYKGLHFSQSNFEGMGHSLCEVLLDLVDSEQTRYSMLSPRKVRAIRKK